MDHAVDATKNKTYDNDDVLGIHGWSSMCRIGKKITGADDKTDVLWNETMDDDNDNNNESFYWTFKINKSKLRIALLQKKKLVHWKHSAEMLHKQILPKKNFS